MKAIYQNWVFGNKARLDFGGSPVTRVSKIVAKEGCASISDSNGNLIFYTDGITVWDSNDDVQLPPGTLGLAGNKDSTQSALIIPNPADSNQYYIFTSDGVSPTGTCACSLITPTGPWSNSLISLTSTNTYHATERLFAIQHENCKDFWILTTLIDSTDPTGPGFLRIIPVTAINGVGLATDLQIKINNTAVDISKVGYMKSNSEGSQIAIADHTLSKLLLFSFDKSNGTVGTFEEIEVPSQLPTSLNDNTPNTPHLRQPYGIEFSPNGEFLYYSINGHPKDDASGTGYIYQVNLIAPSYPQVLIGTRRALARSYSIGALQLADDGMIYIVQVNDTKLARIASPNKLGTACVLQWGEIPLQPNTNCAMGLPNIPTLCSCDCDCSGCNGCNSKAEAQNEALIEKAKLKTKVSKSNVTCAGPFLGNCPTNVISSSVDLTPCFYLHRDPIVSGDHAIFFITVCNEFNDVQFNGLRITKINILPPPASPGILQVVPDRFIHLDCLAPCTCQTREFTIIGNSSSLLGQFELEIDYCYDDISIVQGSTNAKTKLDF